MRSTRFVAGIVVCLIFVTPLRALAADKTSGDVVPHKLPVDPALRIPDRGDQPVSAHLPRPLAASLRTSMSTGFDGLGNLNHLSPSDTTGAGGDNHVFAAVNSSYELFTKTGTSEVGPGSFHSLFPAVDGAMFDPRVVYDSYDDTYVLEWLGYKGSTNSSWLFVVSIPDATAGTPSTWCKRKFKTDQQPDQIKTWADYPGLGFDDQRVYSTMNQWGFKKGFYGSQILAFDKTSLYDCAGPAAFDVFGPEDTRFPDGRKSFTLQPATTAGTLSGDYYLLSFEGFYGKFSVAGNTLELYRIRDVGGSLKLRATQIHVAKAKMEYSLGTQKGAHLNDPDAYWATGDLEFANSFYDADLNTVYGAFAVENDLGANGWVDSALRWYEISPASVLGNSSVLRHGTFGTVDTDAGWPVITTDSAGNAFVAFSRASGVTGSKEYLSSYVTVIEPGDNVPAPANTLLLDAGNALYDPYPGPERWGDFAAINRDPVDGANVWDVGQIADGGGSARTDDFQQVFDLVSFP